jgi:hypothetical protein
MSNFKQVVIDFLVSKPSKLPVIYHPLLSSYLALSKNTGKNNMKRFHLCVAVYYAVLSCSYVVIRSRRWAVICGGKRQ